MKLIESLREKPKYVKVQVAFSIALIVTLVVGTFWVTTLPAKLSGISGGASSQQETEQGSERDPSPFSGLIERTGSQTGTALRGDTPEAAEPAPDDEPAPKPGAMGGTTATRTEEATTTSQQKPGATSTTSTSSALSGTPRMILIGTTSSNGTE